MLWYFYMAECRCHSLRFVLVIVGRSGSKKTLDTKTFMWVCVHFFSLMSHVIDCRSFQSTSHIRINVRKTYNMYVYNYLKKRIGKFLATHGKMQQLEPQILRFSLIDLLFTQLHCYRNIVLNCKRVKTVNITITQKCEL